MAKKVQTYLLSEPLPGATEVMIDINTVDGNLSIDGMPGGTELASGTLQYLENQEPPTHSVQSIKGRATLTVKSGSKGQPWLRMPWAACNGATEWQIHLSPAVNMEINAHSGGGNVTLNLTGLKVTCLNADTGGGNLEVYLPDRVAGMQVTIKSGAGNVTVHLPSGMAARVHATTGLGKVIMDGPFIQTGKTTYQSPEYDNAVSKVEITASSGAGNVSIKETAPAAARI